jgi:hypothetical protein
MSAERTIKVYIGFDNFETKAKYSTLSAIPYTIKLINQPDFKDEIHLKRCSRINLEDFYAFSAIRSIYGEFPFYQFFREENAHMFCTVYDWIKYLQINEEHPIFTTFMDNLLKIKFTNFKYLSTIQYIYYSISHPDYKNKLNILLINFHKNNEGNNNYFIIKISGLIVSTLISAYVFNKLLR